MLNRLGRRRPVLDWPSVNDFLREKGCVPVVVDVALGLAGRAGCAASYDRTANTITIVSTAEAMTPEAAAKAPPD